MKRIAVLTSGGDAPGMNAAIRAVVRAAIHKDMEILGIKRGYNGLLGKDFIKMDLHSVSDTIRVGGTILYSARSVEYNSEEGVKKAAQICRELNIEGIVVIGGDGSFRGARDLSLQGVPCVGIPATIDNDIVCSEYTIGYDTAMNTATEMVDRLRDTSESHDRCSVVEIMGRRAGYLALQTGISVGATAILVPEIEHDLDRDVVDRIKKARNLGKTNFIVVVAEGVGKVAEIAEYISEKTGIESRPTILGHVQRGGSPTVMDRVMASRMGYHAVKLLHEGIGNRVVAARSGNIEDFDILEALNMKKPFDTDLYDMAMAISI